MFSNSQSESFNLLSSKSLEECLAQTVNENNNDGCFHGNACFCDGTSCNDCDASCH
jgi:hypothetical protein